MEQDGELASDCHHSLILGLLASSFSQMKSPSTKRGAFACSRRIWLAHSISRLPSIGKAIDSAIREIVLTGALGKLEKLRSQSSPDLISKGVPGCDLGAR